MKNERKALFETRFKKYYPRLCSIACGYVSETDVCEDIVQETFISIWNNQKDALPESDFYMYMVSCVRNRCISHLRKEKNSLSLPIDRLQISDHENHLSDQCDEHVIYKHPEDYLQKILQILPERCRTIFVMSKLQAIKYKDIATQLAISEKTVENQMGKALKLLRVYAMNHPLHFWLSLIIFQIMINKWK